MTREERLDWLCRLRSGLVWFDVPPKERPVFEQVLSEVIKDLEQEPCEDAVSREKVLGCFEFPNTKRKDFIEAIKKLPSVTPTPNKGKWLNKNASGHHFYGKCSECGQEFCVDAWYTQNMKFCPNCGAEMR